MSDTLILSNVVVELGMLMSLMSNREIKQINLKKEEDLFPEDSKN
jgi:predicted nucleotide-binding protein